MRRIVTMLMALVLFGLLSYDSASAGEGHKSVLKKAQELCAKRLKSLPAQAGGNGYEKVLAEDGTLVVCGKGEKAPWSETAGPEVSAADASGQFCKPEVQNIAKAMKSQGLPQGEIAKFLIHALKVNLRQAQLTGSWHNETTDALFSQIKESMAALDWSGKDLGWHWNGAGAPDDLWDLAVVGREYGKRYGMRVISLFDSLSYGPNRDGSDWKADNLNLFTTAIEGMLVPNVSVPESERPTVAESQALAEMLPKLAQAYKRTIFLWTNTEEKLAAIAPHVLAELKKISEEIEWQKEIDKISKANDN